MKNNISIVSGAAILVLMLWTTSLYSQITHNNTYTYDSLNRLKNVICSNGLSISYQFDALSNRIKKTAAYLLPASAGNVTGSNQVCAGDSLVAYSTSGIQYAVWYLWTLPVGATIVSGDSTPNIMVRFGSGAQSGNVTVRGKNKGGTGSVSAPLNVTVKNIPGIAGTISGASQVQQGQSGVIYSVSPITGATGYIWTLPSGASITSGSNTAAITVQFGSSASSGVITVKGSNSCGNGTTSPAFAVTVNTGIPAMVNIQNTTIPSGSIACYNATQTITLAGNGTTFTVPVNAHVELIAGQKIRFLPGVSVAQGSWLTGNIRPGGPWCNSAKNAVADIAGTEHSEDTPPVTAEVWQVRAWPNPVSGDLTVDWVIPCNQELTLVEITNMLGKRVFSTQVSGVHTITVPMSALPAGIYFLKVTWQNNSTIRKIIRQM